MIKLFNSVMGSIDSSPYAPRSKQIAPLVGAALVTGGSSLLGNLLGSSSQSSANRINLQIARETNEMNYKMFQEQLAYNEDMWNKQNEYNLPANQVERLLAAGINPASVFGNGSVSEAGSLTAPQAPNMMGAHVNPYNYDLSGVGQAVNAYFANESLSKDIESKGLDNQAKQIDLQFKVSRILLDMKEQIGRIDKQLADKSVSESQRDYLFAQKNSLENNIRLFEDSYDYLKEREKLTNDVMKEQKGNLIADTALKRYQGQFQALMMQYYPQITEAQLNVMSAQFDDLVQSAQLKAKEGELTSAKAVGQYLQNGVEAIHFGKESLKDKARNSNKATRTFYGTLDMIGETIFSNIRLFK